MPTKLVELDAEVLGLARDAFDDLLDISVLGKTCRLHYKETYVACAACDQLGPAGSGGTRWATGPHVPGGRAACSDCGGSGQVAVHPTEDLVLRVNYLSGKTMRELSPDVAVTTPDCLMKTRGYLTDAPKVAAAEFIIVQPELLPTIRLKFERQGEPYDPSNIVKGRYFACHWRRVP